MLGLFIVLLGGCGAPATPERPNPPPAPPLTFSTPEVAPGELELAISVARELQQRPAEAEAVLAEHQLSHEAWEHLLVDVATDPEAAARYAEALATPSPTAPQD